MRQPCHEKLSPAQVTWLCAVQADGSFRRKSTIVFNFSKARKIDRLVAAMQQLGITYTVHEYQYGASKSFTHFNIGPSENQALLGWTINLLGRTKTFGSWLLNLDRASLDLFAEEVLEWDGKARTRECYFSVESGNADWVQILWTLSGRRSRVLKYAGANENSRPLNHAFQQVGKQCYSTTSLVTREEIFYSGPLFSVSTPAGFVVLRRDGKAIITADGGLKRNGSPSLVRPRDVVSVVNS